MSTPFKSEWLQPGAVIPVDIPTLAAFAEELRRVMQEKCEVGMIFDASAPVTITSHPYFYKRPWVSLTDEEIKEIVGPWGDTPIKGYTRKLFDQIEAKLREKNT